MNQLAQTQTILQFLSSSEGSSTPILHLRPATLCVLIASTTCRARLLSRSIRKKERFHVHQHSYRRADSKNWTFFAIVLLTILGKKSVALCQCCAMFHVDMVPFLLLVNQLMASTVPVLPSYVL